MWHLFENSTGRDRFNALDRYSSKTPKFQKYLATKLAITMESSFPPFKLCPIDILTQSFDSFFQSGYEFLRFKQKKESKIIE